MRTTPVHGHGRHRVYVFAFDAGGVIRHLDHFGENDKRNGSTSPCRMAKMGRTRMSIEHPRRATRNDVDGLLVDRNGSDGRSRCAPGTEGLWSAR